MSPDRTTETRLAAAPTSIADGKRSLAITAKNLLTVSEPVTVFVQSLTSATVLWAFLLYFGLLMYAFLWSLSDARDLYILIMGSKAINWIITAAVITGVVLHVLRLRALQELRSPAPQYYAPAATVPRRKTGVYGRADAAADFEIDAALRGKTGGFEAIFEE